MFLPDLATQLPFEQGLGIASVPGRQASPQSQGALQVDPPDPPDLGQPALSVPTWRWVAQAELVMPSDQTSCVIVELSMKL